MRPNDPTWPTSPSRTAVAEPTPVLTVRDLHFAHPGAPALFSGWCADIPAGLTLLEGDMGSGKTSLLRLLAGEWAGRGERVLRGGLNLAAHAAAYRAAVNWFDPRDPAFDALTPAALAAKVGPPGSLLDTALWQAQVAGFGLAPHLDKPLYMLSTGTRRKAGLAAALSCACVLTLLDEPGAGLDGPSLAHLTRALNALAASPDRAVVLVSSVPLDDLAIAQRLHLPPT